MGRVTTVAREALLVMDMQNGVVGRFGDLGAVLETVGSVVTAARAADVTVIYVRIAFRDGSPEISPNNRTFSARARSGLSETDPSTQIHPAVAAQPGDIIVTKRRLSAFAGSDLEVVLRDRAQAAYPVAFSTTIRTTTRTAPGRSSPGSLPSYFHDSSVSTRRPTSGVMDTRPRNST